MSEALLGQGLALASAFSFAFANVLIARSPGRRDSRGVVFSVLVTAVFAAFMRSPVFCQWLLGAVSSIHQCVGLAL